MMTEPHTLIMGETCSESGRIPVELERFAPRHDGATMSGEGKETRTDDLREVAVASMLRKSRPEPIVHENLDCSPPEDSQRSSLKTFGIRQRSMWHQGEDTGLFAVRAAYGFSPEAEARIKKGQVHP